MALSDVGANDSSECKLVAFLFSFTSHCPFLLRLNCLSGRSFTPSNSISFMRTAKWLNQKSFSDSSLSRSAMLLLVNNIIPSRDDVAFGFCLSK